jgi:hypothetical protein
MTQEKFNQILKLRNEIDIKERTIRDIDSLLKSTKLGCKITGNSKESYRQPPEHYFSNQEEIIKMLQLDKDKITIELSQLIKLFNEQ